MNMQAGGVGITLTAANNMIMLDYDWLPAINEQAEQRIVRPGQNSFCNIYYIYCTNSIFDDLFVRMISEKAENISKAIDDSDNLFDLATTLSESSTYLELLKKEIKAKYGEQVKAPKKRKRATKKES
jgi:SNF2 family DNA or RNA helicase